MYVSYIYINSDIQILGTLIGTLSKACYAEPDYYTLYELLSQLEKTRNNK